MFLRFPKIKASICFFVSHHHYITSLFITNARDLVEYNGEGEGEVENRDRPKAEHIPTSTSDSITSGLAA